LAQGHLKEQLSWDW